MSSSSADSFLSGVICGTLGVVTYAFVLICTESSRLAIAWTAISVGAWLLYIVICSIHGKDDQA